ncbi:hypothetical protein L2U69_02180 [Zavarzinia compransoris]|uniref:hypothetical protein n=1 Tax=Zavarzinia marina TaxID=2911065 RepID=UPI001F2ABAA7|nr:hypothetical protein [Zavarzinia marina]MCF4164454.1 hypothetical protein [Zavarzinia marina]
MTDAVFDRAMAVMAWACRPGLLLFPLLLIAEIAGLVPMEMVLPFASMALIHIAGRRQWLTRRAERAGEGDWVEIAPVAVPARIDARR